MVRQQKTGLTNLSVVKWFLLIRSLFASLTFLISYSLTLLLTTCLHGGVITGSGDIVLGQNDFTHGGPNITDDKGVVWASGLAIDATRGRIYVADSDNNRVLWWNDFSSLTSGKQADGVLGQADLYSSQENRGGAVAANTLFCPSWVSVDVSGNVWIADSENHRVLKYNTPSANGVDAVLVLGQADFTHNSYNRGGTVAANTLYYPCGVSVDNSGNVWVVDGDNERVLKYNVPSANGVDAVILRIILQKCNRIEILR